MRRFLFFISFITVMAACSRNAITGRKQISLYAESEIQSMATEEYNKFLSNHKVLDSGLANSDAEMVARVGARIGAAIVEYYKSKGLQQPEGYKWEYKLIESPERNAWYMPGGKLVVYSGLLPLLQNETNLAIVMGHLVTHDLAKHGNERMSQGLFQQLGGVGLSVASVNQPKETQNLFLNAYGIEPRGSDFLPFSKKQEIEADRLGLQLTAMAGYDPRGAVDFWSRAKIALVDKKQPELLYTHPLDDKRITLLKDQALFAAPFYKASGTR